MLRRLDTRWRGETSLDIGPGSEICTSATGMVGVGVMVGVWVTVTVEVVVGVELGVGEPVGVNDVKPVLVRVAKTIGVNVEVTVGVREASLPLPGARIMATSPAQ